jgi:hypothetical protein
VLDACGWGQPNGLQAAADRKRTATRDLFKSPTAASEFHLTAAADEMHSAARQFREDLSAI